MAFVVGNRTLVVAHRSSDNKSNHPTFVFAWRNFFLLARSASFEVAHSLEPKARQNLAGGETTGIGVNCESESRRDGRSSVLSSLRDLTRGALIRTGVLQPRLRSVGPTDLKQCNFKARKLVNLILNSLACAHARRARHIGTRRSP